MICHRWVDASVALIASVCLLVACGGQQAPTPEVAVSPAPTSTQLPTATVVPIPTDTPPQPTSTLPPPTETAPPPTDTPQPPPTDTPALPTNTPQPLPTDTAALPTATVSAPPPSATPTLEPVTVRLREGEGRRETVGANRPIIVEWGWAVCNPGLLQENVDSMIFEIRLDGAVMASGPMQEYRGPVVEGDGAGGVHTWGVSWSYPLGPFESGSSHKVELLWTFSRAVSDGCDSNGDGQLDMFGPSVSTLRLELVTQ
jgi:hypothetical protein